jgi:hypothetical protein
LVCLGAVLLAEVVAKKRLFFWLVCALRPQWRPELWARPSVARAWVKRIKDYLEYAELNNICCLPDHQEGYFSQTILR